MAYNVTITEVAANVAVNESSYPVTVSYNAVQLDGVNVSSAEVNVAGNLILTLSDATTIDSGYVVGPAGADGADGTDGTNGTDGTDGVSVTTATVDGVGNLVVTLSDATVIDTGHVVGADGAAGADGADGAPGVDGTDGTDGVSVVDADVTGVGNLQLTLSDTTTIDAGPLPTGDISYTISDGSNTQIISDGDTITFNGTTNEIDVLVSATDTVTVGLVDNPTVGGNLTVTGNLTVNGTTTTINTATLDVEDLNITVAKGAADATAANGAGLTVDGAGATLTYNSTGNVWAFDRNITVSGADVTSTKIGQWDTAYGWGDHSLAGYLTSYTETNDLTSAVTWANVPDANITQSSVTQHQAALSITESQISDLSHTTSLPFASITSTPTTVAGYGITDALTAETNDLTSAVTWANVPDANITQSSVTQHQAALSITESQISDLSHTVETNDLTTAVTWANIPDANVPQSAVTQHQAALSITESQITDLAHYSDADVDTHLNTGTASASQILSYTGTDYDWIDVSASGLTNVVEDTTPQLGGDLDLNGNDITGTGNIDVDTITGTEIIGLHNGPIVFDVIARGTAIVKGQVVYLSGISGNIPEVQLARANSSTTMPAFGVAEDDIAQDATGKIVAFNQLQGTDVADWGETGITFALGDILYVSATEAGKLTNVAPTGETNLIQNIGKVERISPTTNATIMVAGAGRTNATPALNTGNIFYGVGNVSSTVNLDTTVASLGFIKDYTVTESDVTAHQAALSITESQISDLSHTTSLPFASITSTPTTLAGYGITDAATSAQGALADTALQAETNDLTSAVTWANVPDANITQSSVTQHQAALSITESQISDLSHTTTLPFGSITSTPTTLAGYGITDALSSTLTGNINMSGYYLTDSSQTGTPVLQLSKSYTDPATSITSYVAQIDGGDLHIDQNKSTPNLVLMTNPNTGSTATTEFRMAGDPVTGSSTYNFGFMSMAGSGYAHPYLANIDPGELFFSNFNGDVVVGTGTGLGTNGSHRCQFRVKSALGSNVFFGPTGLPDFDALVVDENGDTTLGATLKLTDFEEKINTGLATTGTLTPDPADGTVQKITLTGDITINALSNVSAGQTVTLIITQPSSGNYTLTSSMLFAGGSKTLSTISNAVDIMTIFYDGSTYYASLAKGFA